MDASSIDIGYRLTLMVDRYGVDAIYGDPPQGVQCDCDERWDGQHFHIRCTMACCDGDECREEFQQNFLAYSRLHGFEVLAQYARDHGWHADEFSNFFLCPRCRQMMSV